MLVLVAAVAKDSEYINHLGAINTMFPTDMHMEAEISLRLLPYRTFSNYKIHIKTCDPNASLFSIMTYYTKQHELNA